MGSSNFSVKLSKDKTSIEFRISDGSLFPKPEDIRRPIFPLVTESDIQAVVNHVKQLMNDENRCGAILYEDPLPIYDRLLKEIELVQGLRTQRAHSPTRMYEDIQTINKAMMTGTKVDVSKLNCQ